jgi:hypothetical protein
MLTFAQVSGTRKEQVSGTRKERRLERPAFCIFRSSIPSVRWCE